ncbi:MAG: hypothetical protein J0M04_13905 [Verrucomicrobia bacterium]|nr:hypothetical protein [Verrucomicrobiota bacterium]
MSTEPKESGPPQIEPTEARGGFTGWILLATLFAILAVPFTDGRVVGRAHQCWKLHDEHLDGLNEALLKFREVHGKFPDNNQGLHAMDTFGSRFNATLESRESRNRSDPSPDDPSLILERNLHRMFWIGAEHNIARFHTAEGRLPANAEELSLEVLPEDYANEDDRRTEIAITSNNQLFFLAPGCVLDPSLTPYVYENRNGLEKGAFSTSPADSDLRRKFSRNPAPGIFVYSLNARDYYHTYRNGFIVRCGGIGGFGILSLACWIMVFLRTRGVHGQPWLRSIPVVGGMLAIGFSAVSQPTCYIASLIPRRNPKSVDAQKRLLEKFHHDGVIQDETYQKALRGFETESIFPPVGRRTPETK